MAEKKPIEYSRGNATVSWRGDIDIAGAPKNAAGSRFRAALCRCGAPQNKPFCDGRHAKTGFTAA